MHNADGSASLTQLDNDASAATDVVRQLVSVALGDTRSIALLEVGTTRPGALRYYVQYATNSGFTDRASDRRTSHVPTEPREHR